jgi:aspartyl-tRNA(Asn)/glutamyl-tRNA(Gln) amidotransferase subunit A
MSLQSASGSHVSDDVAYLTAGELAQQFEQGALSPVEVARALLDRVEALDLFVNAFVHVDPEATLAMARASESRRSRGEQLGPLDGVPVTIKDLTAVAGWPLKRGSPALQDDPPPRSDAPAVARLREAGAVFLGKTATPDAGSKIVTRSLVHGVTRNPYDLARTPGGSSGGASAALALGFGPLALGTDGAGSIRIPAAWSGVFGLKPSFGRVPAYPPDSDMPHSVAGPMTRSVDDAVAFLDVIARADSRDPYALVLPLDRHAAEAKNVAGLRVGVTRDFGLRTPFLDDAVHRAVHEAAEALRQAGATLVEVSPTWPCDPFETFVVFWEAGYAGFLHTAYSGEKSSRMDPDLLAIAERGLRVDIVTYHRALGERVALAAASKALFNSLDLLIGPVMPGSPPLVERDAPEGFAPGDWRWCPFTYLWNMTGQPAASVPWGLDELGLPVGVQIVGPVAGEAAILRASRVVEAAGAHLLPRPVLPATSLATSRSAA